MRVRWVLRGMQHLGGGHELLDTMGEREPTLMRDGGPAIGSAAHAHALFALAAFVSTMKLAAALRRPGEPNARRRRQTHRPSHSP